MKAVPAGIVSVALSPPSWPTELKLLGVTAAAPARATAPLRTKNWVGLRVPFRVRVPAPFLVKAPRLVPATLPAKATLFPFVFRMTPPAPRVRVRPAVRSWVLPTAKTRVGVVATPAVDPRTTLPVPRLPEEKLSVAADRLVVPA